ncbi:MAG: type II secretion system protein [Campylobacter sp.]|nr:type II secretion system protein [Campylobacter sp.]
MKKGFTMIELIFVIVILGILAAVAVPRLTATRDDAELAKAATNVSTVISDFTSYYTSQGSFAADNQDMTNVDLPIKIKNDTCAEFETTTDGNLTITQKNGGLCDDLWKLDSMKNIPTEYQIGGKGVKW